MAEEKIDGAVKWLMKRLMETSAESFELAFARYETSEREAALAQARRLTESEDPAERELGERLRAEVMKVQQNPASLMLDAPGGNGLAHDPLSLSPSPSSPAAASPSPGPEEDVAAKRGGRPSRPSPEQNHRPQAAETPAKRGPGRPRKS